MSSGSNLENLFVFVTWELSPYYKMTGVGDLLRNLIGELSRRGLRVMVICPDFGVRGTDLHFKQDRSSPAHLSVLDLNLRVRAATDAQGVEYYLIQDERLTKYLDDPVDYLKDPWLAGLCFEFCYQAYLILDALARQKEQPVKREVVHAFHWQSGPLLALLNKSPLKDRIRAVMTVDILDQQGRFDPGDLNPHEIFHTLFFHSKDEVNFLRMAIESADILHTVSPNYAGEILIPPNGRGLEELLTRRHAEGKLVGILNGLDPKFVDWHCIPVLNDNRICLEPGRKDTARLKTKAKLLFQEVAGLPRDESAFLISMGHRFVRQKNFSLVAEAMDLLMSLKPRPQIYLRAWPEPKRGDPEWELWYRIIRLSKRYRHNLAFLSPYDRDSELTEEGIFIDRFLYYAASDLFFMPSLWEPCGLCQLEAMRFGAIPVVHKVGGLVDTVTPFNGRDKGRGFQIYDPFDPALLTSCVAQAQDLWLNRPKTWQGLVERAMGYDSSIVNTADSYMSRLYLS